MFKSRIDYKLVNILVFMLILFLLCVTSSYWMDILKVMIKIGKPFMLAFGISYALYPSVKFLMSHGLKKGLSVSIIIIGVICLSIALISATLPMIYDQLVLFSKMILEVIQDVSLKFDLNLGEFQVSISNSLNKLINDLSAYVSTGTVSFLGKSLDMITKGIIVIIVAIYFLFDMDKIRAEWKQYLKRGKKKNYDYIKTLDHEISNYFHGLFLFMMVQLMEYTIVFKLIGHPNWLILGVLASITTIIPYFGGMMTNVIAILTATVVSERLFIATIIVCLIFPQIDSYIISPKIYGKTNNISPVCTIFAVFAGEILGGFMGIVIALPVYIVLNATYKYYKKDIKWQVEKRKTFSK